MRRLIRIVCEFLEDEEWWLPALGLLLIAGAVTSTQSQVPKCSR